MRPLPFAAALSLALAGCAGAPDEPQPAEPRGCPGGPETPAALNQWEVHCSRQAETVLATLSQPSFLLVQYTVQVMRQYEDGRWRGDACGVSAPPRFHFEPETHTVEVALSREDAPFADSAVVLVRQSSWWNGCEGVSLEFYARAADEFPLNVESPHFRVGLSGHAEGSNASLSNGLVVQPGRAAGYLLNRTFPCQDEDCGAASWVRYDGSFAVTNLGPWPVANVVYYTEEEWCGLGRC